MTHLNGNHIIQSLWIGEQLSNNELLCVQSYLYNGHDFHLYVYERPAGVPQGVKLMDANRIITRSRLFKDHLQSYASFADWFRLKLLLKKGGWWVDMDTVCIQPFLVEEPYCFSSEWEDISQTKKDVNNTCMKVPRGAPYLTQLVRYIEERLTSDSLVEWGEFGVYLLRKIHPPLPELRPYIKDPAVFCPVNYFDISQLLCGGEFVLNPETRCIHLWNEIWRRAHLNKQSRYHPDSIYEQLKRKFLE